MSELPMAPAIRVSSDACPHTTVVPATSAPQGASMVMTRPDLAARPPRAVNGRTVAAIEGTPRLTVWRARRPRSPL